MFIEKYSKNIILTIIFITTAAHVHAINLEALRNYSYNFGTSTIKSIKDYTHPFALSAFETVKKHQTFIYYTLGATALGIAGYKSLQNYKQYRQKEKTLSPRKTRYFISPETYIVESYFDNPFTNDKSIFLNVFTNNQFIEHVSITTEKQTILFDYRNQHKEFIQSLSYLKRFSYWLKTIGH